MATSSEAIAARAREIVKGFAADARSVTALRKTIAYGLIDLTGMMRVAEPVRGRRLAVHSDSPFTPPPPGTHSHTRLQAAVSGAHKELEAVATTLLSGAVPPAALTRASRAAVVEGGRGGRLLLRRRRSGALRSCRHRTGPHTRVPPWAGAACTTSMVLGAG
jgi:hypothetical protein